MQVFDSDELRLCAQVGAIASIDLNNKIPAHAMSILSLIARRILAKVNRIVEFKSV